MKTLDLPGLRKGCISGWDDTFILRYAKFCRPGGLEEYYLTLQPGELSGDFEAQLGELARAYAHALKALDLPADTAILRRFFCSDPANQKAALAAHPLGDAESPALVSLVGQAPLPAGKIALWAHHLCESGRAVSSQRRGNRLEFTRGDLTHCWETHRHDAVAADSYGQTRNLFGQYIDSLKARGMTLEGNVVRTWLYLPDIDANYQGLVDARRELFLDHGLSPRTHYIASTGIEGRSADPAIKVSMDGYAIAGLPERQVRYLHAPSHLGATHTYGVSFERATAIAYGDRQHIHISGTASIDPAGKVVHPGRVDAQLERALENVEALLKDANTTLDAVACLTVYLRDHDDAGIARNILGQRCPFTPALFTWAPVCRPAWLVEIEGLAITDHEDKELPGY